MGAGRFKSGPCVRMGHIEFSCRHGVSVLLLVLVCVCQESAAQQEYYNTDLGYQCTDTVKKSCHTYVLYRAQPSYSSIQAIAQLFNANQSAVARANNVTVGQSLSTGDALLVPVSCGCYNDSSYAKIKYTIVNGDTFFGVSTINFEYLSTYNATINANPGIDYFDLQINSTIVVPVRCACPTNAQNSSDVSALVTYPVLNGDTVGQVAQEFDVPSTSILNANELVGANLQINEDTTLLVPINNSRPTFVAQSPPPPVGNSSPPSPPPTPGPKSGKKSSHVAVYVAVAVGVCVAVVILVAIAVCLTVVLRRRAAGQKHDSESPLVARGAASTSISGMANASALSTRNAPGDPLAGMADLVDSDKPALFTYEEIKDATNDFSDGSRLQGSVYRGILRGHVRAVKQMKGNMSQELRILCRVHHTNLVRLVGVCITEAEHMYLVYEYAENGSLSDCLHTDYLSRNKLSTRSSSYLSFTMRVQVALDAASGLEYIHDYVTPSYVHKDVKSSNILLDGSFRAKIANFAMAKSGGNNAVMTRHIAGTYGYMAPEYLAHGLVTPKADVFAFGVVLLELLSGQEAISDDESSDGKCLYSSIRPILDGEDPGAALKNWMDPVLESNYPTDTARSLASLAKRCVETDPGLRPSMKDITFALSNLLNATLEWETSCVFANTLMETPIEAR